MTKYTVADCDGLHPKKVNHMDHEIMIQQIHEYFANLTDEQFELDKKKSNWELYSSKMFQGIRIFGDEDEYEPVTCTIGEQITINNIYDSDGNVVENNVVFEFTEDGWERVGK